MARPPIRREITTEDFEPEYSQLVTRLAYVINPFIGEVTEALDKDIDFDNLESNLISLTLTIGNDGAITTGNQVNVGIINPLGISVIGARNTINSAIYPTSMPFISFTPIGNNIIRIDNITGLTQGTYQINMIVY